MAPKSRQKTVLRLWIIFSHEDFGRNSDETCSSILGEVAVDDLLVTPGIAFPLGFLDAIDASDFAFRRQPIVDRVPTDNRGKAGTPTANRQPYLCI